MLGTTFDVNGGKGMSKRGEELANRFEAANREIISTVEKCSDAQWRTRCAGETWSVGVVAHHVAESHAGIARIIQTVAAGQPLPQITTEMIDERNAQHARQHANCTKEETLELLRKNGASAVAAVRGLSDEQLQRSGTLRAGPMTAEQVVERILIGHAQGHLASIRAAIG
jgi:uncharacterized damage-inducible protein DinB